jgi:hypothetical protein
MPCNTASLTPRLGEAAAIHPRLHSPGRAAATCCRRVAKPCPAPVAEILLLHEEEPIDDSLHDAMLRVFHQYLLSIYHSRSTMPVDIRPRRVCPFASWWMQWSFLDAS